MKPTLIAGDCRHVLKAFPSNHFDSIVTDPPYGLSKHPDMAEVLKHWLAGDDYTATGGGFMGKTWDSFVPGPATWSEVLRVMKPGAYAAVFAGSRTQDLMATALRLAGFEVLDTLFWMNGQGFPKSMSVSRAVDIAGGTCHCTEVDPNHKATEHDKQKTEHHLRPLHPCDVSPPFDDCGKRGEVLQQGVQEQNALKHGPEGGEPEIAGGEQPCVERGGNSFQKERELQERTVRKGARTHEACREEGRVYHGAQGCDDDDVWVPADADGGSAPRGPRPDEQRPDESRTMAEQRVAQEERPSDLCRRCGKPDPIKWEGYGTALKPAYEPIILCRKPLDGTYANNIMVHGCGALNIDGSRNGERWPANVLHDGCLPEPMDRYFYCAKATKADRDAGLAHWPDRTAGQATDRKEGTAGLDNPRSGAGRTGGSKNPHVTVKPTELMRWLCKLITPPGGGIGDPFCGSGSTGRGAKLGGFEFTGIDLDPVNIKVSADRIDNIES